MINQLCIAQSIFRARDFLGTTLRVAMITHLYPTQSHCGMKDMGMKVAMHVKRTVSSTTYLLMKY